MTKVKNLFLKHFPDTTTTVSSTDDTQWLESVLENLKMQLVSNKSNHISSTSSSSNAKHLNNNCSDVEKLTNNNNNNSTLNGDSTNISTSKAADNELILLQNAQLKTTLEEYKNIISETVSWKY